jgi:hypothetical protein
VRAKLSADLTATAALGCLCAPSAACVRPISSQAPQCTIPRLPVSLSVSSQEYHILQGARAYIRAHPVHYILLEYYPKGLRAGGVNPIDMLRLLQHELGYQCFDLRCNPGGRGAGARTFEQFVRAYPAMAANEFGTWSDLLCTRFDLL